MDNSKDRNICKKCIDSSIEIMREKSKVESLKMSQTKLSDMLKMERRKIAKMQMEIDELKIENEQFNMVPITFSFYVTICN